MKNRLLTLIRLLIATTYSLSLVGLISSFFAFGLSLLADFGYFDKIDEREILCTLPDVADGTNSFHGEYYQRPQLSVLEDLHTKCLNEEARDEVYNQYYGDERPGLFPQRYIDKYTWDYTDCSKIGVRHRELFERKFSRACVGVQPNTAAIVQEKTRPKYFLNEVDALIIGLMAALFSFISYCMNYVIFGITSLLPRKQYTHKAASD